MARKRKLIVADLIRPDVAARAIASRPKTSLDNGRLRVSVQVLGTAIVDKRIRPAWDTDEKRHQ